MFNHILTVSFYKTCTSCTFYILPTSKTQPTDRRTF